MKLRIQDSGGRIKRKMSGPNRENGRFDRSAESDPARNFRVASEAAGFYNAPEAHELQSFIDVRIIE
jgi:hypothetical protein